PTFLYLSYVRRPVDEIQQREQENPHDIDEVPIQPKVFYRRVVTRVVTPFPSQDHHWDQDPDAHDHVQRVRSRHHKVEAKKNLGLVLEGWVVRIRLSRFFTDAIRKLAGLFVRLR